MNHEDVKKLEPEEILVFGSNLEGKHPTVLEKFGATQGMGVGLQGKCYAIPVDGTFEQFSNYVKQFFRVAVEMPAYDFLVQKLENPTYDEMAVRMLFLEVPENVFIPEDWL
jgi:hypothetical protein